MTEVSRGQIQTAALDHLALVAAVCQDLKISQRIDHRLLMVVEMPFYNLRCMISHFRQQAVAQL